jgi:thiol:disulfide interchange protein DsbC
MKKVVEKRKDVVFYLKLYPCKSLKDSSQKSKSIICNQSMKMLEDSYERKPIPNTECKSSELDDNKSWQLG